MNSFKSYEIYIGNLLIIKNDKNEIFRKNVYLIYEDKKDRFYSLTDTLNYFANFISNPNMSNEERKEIEEKIKKYEYNYICKGYEGEIYVDIHSIKVLENGEKNGIIKGK